MIKLIKTSQILVELIKEGHQYWLRMIEMVKMKLIKNGQNFNTIFNLFWQFLSNF
jgi:hypothetical protein